jgi:hypothetical protein
MRVVLTTEGLVLIREVPLRVWLAGPEGLVLIREVPLPNTVVWQYS